MTTGKTTLQNDVHAAIIRLDKALSGFQLLHPERMPRRGSPPSAGRLVALEETLGLKLPPSYRAFMTEADGWRDFDFEAQIDLFSIDYMMSDDYRSFVTEFRSWRGNKADKALQKGVVIGRRQQSGTERHLPRH
jgi:hypothetical protein